MEIFSQIHGRTHLIFLVDNFDSFEEWEKDFKFAGGMRGIGWVVLAYDSESDKLFNIKFLTLFSFSSENWSRPQKEVKFLMNLLRKYLSNKINKLMKDNVSVKMIGEKKKLPKDIVKKINNYQKLTQKNTGLNLIFALNYGSRNEIIISVRKIINKFIKRKFFINEKSISSNLFTKNIPDPDLLIRTSGEKRLSNFLLWQLAYTELVFLDVLWPDFKKKHFLEALNQYSKRVRRYGSR